MFEIIFGIFVAFIVIGFIWSRIVTGKVKKEGIETEAVVSRIEIHEWESGDVETWTGTEITKEPYVTFINTEGETVEAMLSNPKRGLEVGDRLKIKYLPEKQDYPVMIERL